MFDPQGLYNRRTYDTRKGQITQKKGYRASNSISSEAYDAVIKLLKHQGYYINPLPYKPPPVPKPINFIYTISGLYYTRKTETILDNGEGTFTLSANDIFDGWVPITDQINVFNANTAIVATAGECYFDVSTVYFQANQFQSGTTQAMILYTWSGSNYSSEMLTIMSSSSGNYNGSRSIATVTGSTSCYQVTNSTGGYVYHSLINTNQDLLSQYANNESGWESILSLSGPPPAPLITCAYEANTVDRQHTFVIICPIVFTMYLDCHVEIQYEE